MSTAMRSMKQFDVDPEKLYALDEARAMIPNPATGQGCICRRTLERMIQRGDIIAIPWRAGTRKFHRILGAELIRYLREGGRDIEINEVRR